jgi:predicted cupin superfamily sugar epimerase
MVSGICATPFGLSPREGQGGPGSPTAAEVATALGLQPHREGGYFRETYRSPVLVPTPVGPRPLATAILYLLTADSPSRWHRLRFDELWFYQGGAPAELLLLAQGGVVDADPVERLLVGPQNPQVVVSGGRWMGGRVLQEASAEPAGPSAGPAGRGAWTLVGCVVTPGFEYEDFELGRPEELLAAFPAAKELIQALT